MSNVITSILTDSSMRGTATVETNLLRSAQAGGAWASAA
jgi:hypothetical protein